MPSSIERHSQPYFTATELNYHSTRLHGGLGYNREQAIKLASCAFISAVARRLGFPQRTISTAQLLFHRYHLFHSYKEPQEVGMTCLFVAAKVEDTLKKTRDIILAAHARRYGTELDAESSQFMEQRKRILGYERLVLETICFDFQITHPYAYVVKFARATQMTKEDAHLAFLIACDTYKTSACLRFPPHVLAAIAISVTMRLRRLNQPPYQFWEDVLVRIEDIEDGSHFLLDLFEFERTQPNFVAVDERHTVDITAVKIQINQEREARGVAPADPPSFRHADTDVDMATMENVVSKDVTRRFLFAE